MGVQAGQGELLGGQDGVNDAAGGAGGHRQAELLVLVGGGDVLVPPGVDAGGQTHHDPGALPRPEVAAAPEPTHGGDGVADLLGGVNDQVAHAVAHG